MFECDFRTCEVRPRRSLLRDTREQHNIELITYYYVNRTQKVSAVSMTTTTNSAITKNIQFIMLFINSKKIITILRK